MKRIIKEQDLSQYQDTYQIEVIFPKASWRTVERYLLRNIGAGGYEALVKSRYTIVYFQPEAYQAVRDFVSKHSDEIQYL